MQCMTEPTRELVEKLDRDRREAAEGMTLEERALGGIEMFDLIVEGMRAVLRLQNPEATEAALERLVIDRLRAAESLENAA